MVDLASITYMSVVVDDLDRAMLRNSAAFGLTWAQPWTGPIHTIVGGAEATSTVTFTYSCQGPPHLELIQAVPGTVWQPGPGLHHVGVSVDDVGVAAASLEANGFMMEVFAADSGWAYVRSPVGLRIELVDRASQPGFDRWLAGGNLGAP